MTDDKKENETLIEETQKNLNKRLEDYRAKKAKFAPETEGCYEPGYTLPPISKVRRAVEDVHPRNLYRTRSGDIVRIIEIDPRRGIYPITVERITDDKDQFKTANQQQMTHTMNGSFISKDTTTSEQDLFPVSREEWVRKFQSLRKTSPVF